jgi:glycogen(starch) synthase
MPEALKRPMRLLMTTDAVGGVWTYAVELAGGLAAFGVQTTLAVLGPEPAPDQRAAARQVPGLDLIVTGQPLDWTASSRAELQAAAQAVAELARAVSPDLIHLNTPALAGLAGWPAPVLGACHSCLLTWWQAVRRGEPPEDFAWRIALQAEGLRACAALIAPTRAHARAVAAAYGVAPPQVVHNGRTGQAAPADQEREAAVLAAGRLWDAGKNLPALDEVAALLSAPVLAAGPLKGPNGESIALEHIQPLGQLDPAALAGRMQQTAVFASLALYEPFGLTALEAAEAGCALVLSDIPTHRELWEGAALFAPARNPRTAAMILRGVLNNARLRRVWSRAALKRAERYTAAAMSAATLEVYATLPAPARAKAAA